MKIFGAAIAVMLLIAGPVLAQSIYGPGTEQPGQGSSDESGLGLDGAAGETNEDVLPVPQHSPLEATGGTQETILPGNEPGTMQDEGAVPQGGAGSMEQEPQGSLPTGEFGTDSGTTLGTESDVAETAVPADTRSVTGTIHKMDMKKGMLILKTDDGKNLELHADKAMMEGEQFKKGKKVTAQYQIEGKMKHVTSLAPAEGKGDAATPPATE